MKSVAVELDDMKLENIAWKGDWVYVYGMDKKTGKRGWVHIWDNVVVKKYGPIDENQSYHGRKHAQMQNPKEAWDILK